MGVRICMLSRVFLSALFILTACSEVTSNRVDQGLDVKVDRSFEADVSQTSILIKSNSDVIYCIGKEEIDRLYDEMSDEKQTDADIADENVHYLKGVNIYAPVYLVDKVGLQIFVDNYDAISKFEIPYYKCDELVNRDLDEASTEKLLRIK